MKDIWGSELHVGDEVVFAEPDEECAYIVIGKVIEILPYTVLVEYKDWGTTLLDPGGVAKRFGDKP